MLLRDDIGEAKVRVTSNVRMIMAMLLAMMFFDNIQKERDLTSVAVFVRVVVVSDIQPGSTLTIRLKNVMNKNNTQCRLKIRSKKGSERNALHSKQRLSEGTLEVVIYKESHKPEIREGLAPRLNNRYQDIRIHRDFQTQVLLGGSGLVQEEPVRDSSSTLLTVSYRRKLTRRSTDPVRDDSFRRLKFSIIHMARGIPEPKTKHRHCGYRASKA